MERFVRGDIVAVLFPFSDLTSAIKRPALVLANLDEEDIILCQITKKERPDKNKIELNQKDIKSGNLKIRSFVRVSKLFTLNKSLVLYKIGSINKNKLKEIVEKLIEIFK